MFFHSNHMTAASMARTRRRLPCVSRAATQTAGDRRLGARRSLALRKATILLAALVTTLMLPVIGATAVTAASAATAPQPPPGGGVDGPFGPKTEQSSWDQCEATKNAFQPFYPNDHFACFAGDDGQVYLAWWPKPNEETWFNPNSGMAMEVYHSSLDWGATVDQWPYNGTATQWWYRYDPNGSSYVRLINANSGLCLGVSGGSRVQKAALVQWQCNDNPDQNWYWRFTGYYYSGWPVYNLINENSGMCVDVPYASKTPGTALWQYSCIGSVAQEWY